jgi:hypothetical protein
MGTRLTQFLTLCGACSAELAHMRLTMLRITDSASFTQPGRRLTRTAASVSRLDWKRSAPSLSMHMMAIYHLGRLATVQAMPTCNSSAHSAHQQLPIWSAVSTNIQRDACLPSCGAASERWKRLLFKEYPVLRNGGAGAS